MSLYAFEGKSPKVADDAYVHPCATVIGAVTIGSGCFIGPGAVLRGDSGVIEIGRGTSIQDNCVVHADRKVVIGEDIIVGHGAIIHDVVLKSRVMVGMGALADERGDCRRRSGHRGRNARQGRGYHSRGENHGRQSGTDRKSNRRGGEEEIFRRTAALPAACRTLQQRSGADQV